MKMSGLLSFLLLMLHVSALRPIPGLVDERIHVETPMVWSAASSFCQRYSGAIFVISNDNKLKNLSFSEKQLSWVGLFRRDAGWKWVDETESTYFNWYGECTAINKTGDWTSMACDTELSFVCEMLSGSWVLVKESKTWQEAKQHCDTYHAGLAIILQDTDNGIICELLDGGLFWIGLAKVEVDSPLKEAWRWVGISKPVTYSYWFKGLFCAVIDWRGFWYDRGCFEKHPYICFRKVSKISEFIPVSENKMWKDAQAHCKLLHMDLVMLKTEEELIELVVYIQGKYSSFVGNLYFWMGLYNNPWIWVNNPLKIQYWNILQPDNLDFENKTISPPDRQACAAIKDGEMYDENCNSALPFFCTARVRSMILVSKPKSWREALKHCRDRYMDLASVTSEMDQHMVKNKIENVQSGYVWIGLNFLLGRWTWVYGDNVVYVNWGTAGILRCPVAYRCGALNVKDGKWEARSCDEKLVFLCYQK